MARRKFPYYIVVDLDSEKRKILILDLNTIQEEIVGDNGRSMNPKEFEYVDDESLHESKWITIPGNKTQQTETIRWIKEMVYPNGEEHPNKCIVYDHRRHFTDPFHEEYKVDTFRQWEESSEEEEEVLEAETVEEDEEDED